MSELVLYNYFRSSTSYRVRIALHFKNLDFKYEPVHLINNGGEQHKTEYTNLNPMAEVPTLVHDGMTLAQSMAIIEYLDEVFPRPSLFPADSQKRARIRQFCENINSFMHPVCNLKILQYLETKHAYTQAQKEEWISIWSKKGFEACENILKKTHGQFCFGDEVSAADLFLIPQIFSAQRFKVDLSPYPLLLKINAHCLSLDFFKKAHPFCQPDTPAADKI
ncbi:MAG: maleylacetoacetate isomerase [Bdellovibrionota bacterium]